MVRYYGINNNIANGSAARQKLLRKRYCSEFMGLALRLAERVMHQEALTCREAANISQDFTIRRDHVRKGKSTKVR